MRGRSCKEVTEFFYTSLALQASSDKSKASKASKGAVFLGYMVRTITWNRVIRKRICKRYYYSRDPSDRINLHVPRDRLVRLNQRKDYGDLGHLKALHRRYLIDSSMLEIVLAYNADMRGLTNYYRLAYIAKFSLRKLHFLWQTSLLKTLSFKLRLSVNQVARQLRIRDGLAVRFQVNGKERVVWVFTLKHFHRLPKRGAAVDVIDDAHFTNMRSDVLDRLHARTCEHCGATDVPCQVHHATN